MYAIELEGKIRVGSTLTGILDPVRITLDNRYDTKEDAESVVARIRKASPSSSITPTIIEV